MGRRADKLRSAVRAYRAGRLGDAAALKSAALCEPASPQLARRIHALADPLPTLRPEPLAALPESSFGGALSRFLSDNGLVPLVVSPEVAESMRGDEIVAARYAIFHDAFHVLSGFDTSLAGELGVWTFVAAQGYGRAFERAAALARVLYPVAAPHRLSALRDARVRGARLGGTADLVLAEPLEAYFADDLDAVRTSVGIDAA